MTPPKAIERRLFLATTAATVLAHATSCGDDESGGLPGGSSDAGGTDAGAGADASARSDAGATSPVTTNSVTSTPAATSTSVDGGATASHGETQYPSVDASTGEGTSSSDGSAPPGETSTAGGTGTASDTSSGGVPTNDACFEGGGTDGLVDDAGAGVLCSTNTDNGDHCHALVIPQSDVSSGVIEATYVLEDGGTGHTHTVMLSAYDFFYLQAGTAYSVTSTTDAGHNHTCWITCRV